MEKLAKKLKELSKQGYETITIFEVLRLIREIQHDAYIKRHKLDS